jgi:hypothetical protein
MRSHRMFAVLAVAGFVAHLMANLLIGIIRRLPEYIWFGSIVFSVLATYTGAIAACSGEAGKRGAAIASAVIGALVLLGLMYSGIYWLFYLDQGVEMAVVAGA